MIEKTIKCDSCGRVIINGEEKKVIFRTAAYTDAAGSTDTNEVYPDLCRECLVEFFQDLLTILGYSKEAFTNWEDLQELFICMITA